MYYYINKYSTDQLLSYKLILCIISLLIIRVITYKIQCLQTLFLDLVKLSCLFCVARQQVIARDFSTKPVPTRTELYLAVITIAWLLFLFREKCHLKMAPKTRNDCWSLFCFAQKIEKFNVFLLIFAYVPGLIVDGR